MTSINDIRDDEIFAELLDAPFTEESEKQYIDGVANWYTSHNGITPEQREALKCMVIRVRRRRQEANTPISWLMFLPVDNFRPKSSGCPKCGGKLVNYVSRISGNRYRNLLVCENTLRHELKVNPV